MPDLVVNVQELRVSAAHVARVHEAVAGVQSAPADLVAAVGHPGLANRVAQFESDWAGARAELSSHLGALTASVRVVAATFEAVEHRLDRRERERHEPSG